MNLKQPYVSIFLVLTDTIRRFRQAFLRLTLFPRKSLWWCFGIVAECCASAENHMLVLSLCSTGTAASDQLAQTAARAVLGDVKAVRLSSKVIIGTVLFVNVTPGLWCCLCYGIQGWWHVKEKKERKLLCYVLGEDVFFTTASIKNVESTSNQLRGHSKKPVFIRL